MKRVWTGRILTGLTGAMLLLDGGVKLTKIPAVMEASAELGFSANVVFAIGVVLLVCTLLYLVPRTAVLGAVLLTGYLGGAIATHARVGNPLFSHTLFPIYIGMLVWVGLYLRDRRLHNLLREAV
jgi:hypothetical protein